jgi:hypothetical protein
MAKSEKPDIGGPFGKKLPNESFWWLPTLGVVLLRSSTGLIVSSVMT